LIEVFYGSWTSSLGLMSAAFHTTFDFISMVISLAAMVLAKHQPTKKFSYGYDRFEILSGFSNGVFLLFVSLFLLKDVIERLFEPVQMQMTHRSSIILVSTLGISVNVAGGIFFREHAVTRGEVRLAHEENIYSILVHIFVDTIGYLGVIASAVLMSWGWDLADPLVALLIIALILYNAIPICKRTGKVLLQTTPTTLKDQVEKLIAQVKSIGGVIEVYNPHFWTQSPGVFVGNFRVKVTSESNEQIVRVAITNLFAPLIAHFTVEVEKDEPIVEQLISEPSFYAMTPNTDSTSGVPYM